MNFCNCCLTPTFKVVLHFNTSKHCKELLRGSNQEEQIVYCVNKCTFALTLAWTCGLIKYAMIIFWPFSKAMCKHVSPTNVKRIIWSITVNSFTLKHTRKFLHLLGFRVQAYTQDANVQIRNYYVSPLIKLLVYFVHLPLCPIPKWIIIRQGSPNSHEISSGLPGFF